MKRITKIWILVLVWIGISISTILIINNHIENKKSLLREEIRNKIENIFRENVNESKHVLLGYSVFDTDYCDRIVKNYKPAEIPKVPNKNDYQKWQYRNMYSYDEVIANWKKEYGDVKSLWNLDWSGNTGSEPWGRGWSLRGIRCEGGNDNFIHTIELFPYQVGLLKSGYDNSDFINKALKESLNIYISNPLSNISYVYDGGKVGRIWEKIHASENEYYGIYQNNYSNSNHYTPDWFTGESIPNGKKYFNGGPVGYASIKTPNSRVYIASSQETDYGIRIHPSNPDIKERNTLYFWWLFCEFLIFWIPISVLIGKNLKQSKINAQIKDETLKEKLLRVCSPSEFMDNYEKAKIDKANELLQEILKTEEEDKLMDLGDRAQKELKVNLIDPIELEKLKRECNPSQYMNPYRPEKVAYYNELYSAVINPELKYSDFIRLKEHLKKLKQKNNTGFREFRYEERNTKPLSK